VTSSLDCKWFVRSRRCRAMPSPMHFNRQADLILLPPFSAAPVPLFRIDIPDDASPLAQPGSPYWACTS
jgi:hypothetical protein